MLYRQAQALSHIEQALSFIEDEYFSLTAEGGHSQAPPFQGGERVTQQSVADCKIFSLEPN